MYRTTICNDEKEMTLDVLLSDNGELKQLLKWIDEHEGWVLTHLEEDYVICLESLDEAIDDMDAEKFKPNFK